MSREIGNSATREETELANSVWAHIGWLKAYVTAALDGEAVRDALLYSERQLNRLTEDFEKYQKLMSERVHYAEGVTDLAMKHRDAAEGANPFNSHPVGASVDVFSPDSDDSMVKITIGSAATRDSGGERK